MVPLQPSRQGTLSPSYAPPSNSYTAPQYQYMIASPTTNEPAYTYAQAHQKQNFAVRTNSSTVDDSRVPRESPFPTGFIPNGGNASQWNWFHGGAQSNVDNNNSNNDNADNADGEIGIDDFQVPMTPVGNPQSNF